MSNISENWVIEEPRTFTIYQGVPTSNDGTSNLADEETWLELTQFVKDDLQWLLSLEHPKFWSYMVHSDQPKQLLVSFLKEYPVVYMRDNLLNQREDMRVLFGEIEHLVFLVFLRLTLENESENHFVSNLGEILYNNYLFTVPIILDICVIYGIGNKKIVKKMIENVIKAAPDFLEDFQEVIPHFVRVLNIVKKELMVGELPKLKNKAELEPSQVRDLILYVSDSAATIQIFLELYPAAYSLFSKANLITQIVTFYSNVLPEIEIVLEKTNLSISKNSVYYNLVQNTRIDLLKITKTCFDFIQKESTKQPDKTEEMIDEYLTLMIDLLSEPDFVSDYNKMFSIEFEIESLLQSNCNVDTMKVNHILEGLALVRIENDKKETAAVNYNFGTISSLEDEKASAKLNSLITQVKDILPHLEDAFINECLKYYDDNPERVISAVLENSLPPNLQDDNWRKPKTDPPKNHSNFHEVLDDKKDINEIRERYAKFALVDEGTYDDEYDDTYDENMDVVIRDEDELDKRRSFVTPRILRAAEGENEEEKEEEEEEEEEEEDEEENVRKYWFVQNPAEVRERNEQRRLERNKRDFVGRGRGQGQSKQVLRNREYKNVNKSFMANHNRKKQASRKMNQGMIPS